MSRVTEVSERLFDCVPLIRLYRPGLCFSYLKIVYDHSIALLFFLSLRSDVNSFHTFVWKLPELHSFGTLRAGTDILQLYIHYTHISPRVHKNLTVHD